MLPTPTWVHVVGYQNMLKDTKSNSIYNSIGTLHHTHVIENISTLLLKKRAILPNDQKPKRDK